MKIRPLETSCKGEIDNNLSQQGRFKRYAGLAMGIAFIWIFAVYVTPWLGNLAFMKPLISFIKENDIKATAIYYTDIEEFAEADHMLRQLMTYPVGNAKTVSSEIHTKH